MVCLGDEHHIIFVNGKNRDESTALGKLIHDFRSTQASERIDSLSA
ncbi:MAG: hypothetical protein LUG57_10570 [Oscillospiraceae bacterium]|nr:hypothetical protein [Oscillospiraceae bacterium]